MKKSLFFGLVAILGLIGCSRNQEIDVPDANLSIFARTESPADTKTVVESGVHVYWEPGDEIAVFTGDQSAKFTTDITAASGTATFKGTFGDATWPEDLDLWAVYPFSEDAVFDGETITTTLPSEQVAREGSFGKDMNLAIAHSNSSTLQFYNVGGGIRFSVTEEGIKKVMFEGLSGEIISGKVKIGMDENGKPEVREVTGGSQFITLLPPTGQETFQPGVWYYIVAIPGSLEGGYKLRFYKDEDYARKVSEKRVEIKRSIFGNIEKADDEIKYEALTTHFPETQEEIVASVELTKRIHKDIHSILWEDEDLMREDIDEIVEEILKIDGVIFALENEDKTAISVVQKDSICVNYMLVGYSSNLNGSLSPEEGESNASQKRAAPEYKTAQNVKEGKKALILAPFQWDFKANIEKVWIPTLYKTFVDRITYLPDTDAGILQFKKELLDQYDLVIIDTHGTTGFSSHPVNILGNYTTASGWDSYLATSTPYSADVLKQLIENGDIQIRQTGLISPLKSSIEYLSVSIELLDDASYDDSCVMIFACESAKTLHKGRPWLDTFTSKGALAVSGAAVSMDSAVLGPTADKLIEMMTLGCSFRDAFRYVTKSSIMSHWSNAIYEHIMANTEVEYEGYDIYNNYVYKQNESKPTQDYFLTNPHAALNDPDVGQETIVFSWDSYSINFPYELSWYYSVNSSTNQADFTSVVYDRSFDVYIDGQPVSRSYFDSNDNTKQSVTYPRLSEGPHTWKVITNIFEKESGWVIGSYASANGDFTVKEQIPAPPQVETFPASVDAQKAFLSGMVTNRSLEGLETGFYYYKLTAQEESTELSASEKERLVMGGKKVLSAGDYKDYFGIDLTDIEQDSKYLFVAYATDEYSQTGKGEVLSFTTGSPSVHVSSVSLNMSSLELGVGNTATLVATVLPENASNKKVTWSSSDESRATVSSQGVVKGISMGNAVITVTTEDGEKTATCKVSVTQSTVHVESVSLNKTDLELTVGNSATLVATVLPENAANKSVTWSSSNSSKATVSSTGVVTGVAEGSAVITATTVDGGKTASCFVTVHQTAQPDPEPRLSVSTGRLDFGNQVKFTQESQDITITNSGTGTLQITSISKTNNYGDLFQLSGWTSGGAIAAGASKTITVSFQPLEEKYYEETLTIVSSNSVGDKKATITICGTGISESGNALIQVSCDELDWGDVEVGNRVTKSFSVMNTGTTDLNISPIKIVATDNTVNPSYFTISPNTSCSVSSGNTLTFNVTFIPESECGYYAMVSIKSNASNATQGTSTVWLSGVGIKASSSYSVATPEIVDLGLSIKWASFNLGATKPEEYGDYFYWGETEPMDDRDASSYKFLNGAQALTKYNTDPYYTYLGLGIIDNKTKLDQEDDAAYVNLGGNWRMPTDAEWTELRENCSWTWTTENGVEGYKVISKKPGYTDKWIFLPAPGERSGTDQYNVGFYGYYWSSSLYTDDPLYAYSIFFSRVYVGRSNKPRYAGISIRPVYSNK